MYGKAPEVVIEIVSNKVGNELEKKLIDYHRMGIAYYVVFDPQLLLSKIKLRVYKYDVSAYIETVERWLPEINLGLSLWQGEYEQYQADWLRWCDKEKNLINTGHERITETQQALSESQDALSESQQHTARLEAKLKALGINLDEV